MKKCYKCSQKAGYDILKSEDLFYTNKQNKDGLEGSCKDCKKKEYPKKMSREEQRNYLNRYRKENRKRTRELDRTEYHNKMKNPEFRKRSCIKSKMTKYGVSKEFVESINNVKNCPICGFEFKDQGTGKYGRGAFENRVIDHNHKTGKVRGIICGACNMMLGSARDSIETLLNAAEYLKTEGYLS